ncbi:MAG: SpoIVB peptidase [Clostridium sp.]|nr:SpoIVB peptidase [Clostridium sp.]
MLIKKMKYLLTPILILILIIMYQINSLPNYFYTSKETMADFSSVEAFNSVEHSEYGLQVDSFDIIPVKKINLNKIEEIELVLGGDSVGVRVSQEGAIVVGFSELIVNGNKISSPSKDAGIEKGDVIKEVNGNDIYNSKSLIEVIEKCKTNKAELTLIRDEKIIKRTVKLYKENEKNKLGLWVRDSTSGVGTLTFYDEKTKKFAALGHPVTDADTNTLYDIKDGDILNASVIGIKKSEKGIPGELKGIFLDSKKTLGQIDKNTECGIFGRYNQNFKVNTERKKIKAGTRDEIEIGKAYIVTTIDETGPCEYEIEILKLFNQNEPNGKSMLIKITDEKLLEKTGGIVQGMSGSPIIQNGKIIGAVTHVLVNKPTMGYGIYIDWMLEEADII